MQDVRTKLLLEGMQSRMPRDLSVEKMTTIVELARTKYESKSVISKEKRSKVSLKPFKLQLYSSSEPRKKDYNLKRISKIEHSIEKLTS